MEDTPDDDLPSLPGSTQLDDASGPGWLPENAAPNAPLSPISEASVLVAPVAGAMLYGAGGRDDLDRQQVWLAPDTAPAQFDPSNEAATAASGSDSYSVDAIPPEGDVTEPSRFESLGGGGVSEDDGQVWLAPVT